MKRKRTKEENIEIIETDKNDFVSTGCTTLNCALGGGFKFGTIVNIVGDKSTGKSLVCAETVAVSKNNVPNFVWKYRDKESGFTFDTKKMYGIEIINEEDNIYTFEEFGADLENVIQDINKDQNLIYILDSLDGLPSRAEVERIRKRENAINKGKSYSDSSYDLEKQKEISMFFRVKHSKIKDKNILLIIVSQVRQNIGINFGPKQRRNGGKALDHQSAQIMWLSEANKLEKEKRAIGITVKAKITKNKIGKPFRECFFDILFDYGIDDISSNIKFYYDLYTDTGKLKEKIKINWKGNEFGSVEKLVNYIEENDEVGELKNLVINKWKEIEESIAPKRKRKF